MRKIILGALLSGLVLAPAAYAGDSDTSKVRSAQVLSDSQLDKVTAGLSVADIIALFGLNPALFGPTTRASFQQSSSQSISIQ